MISSRVLGVGGLGLIVSAHALHGQGGSHYREFQLGADLPRCRRLPVWRSGSVGNSVGEGPHASRLVSTTEARVVRSRRNRRPSCAPLIRRLRSGGPPSALAVNETRLRYGGDCVSWRSGSASSWCWSFWGSAYWEVPCDSASA
jgi:hypothetical protein